MLLDPRRGALVALLAAVCLAACSPSRMGINRMAAALTDTATAYSRDDDPEFVRLAAPATLKMIEMMLDQQPRHGGLLLTACSGFTQYAYAFLQSDAELAPPADSVRAGELRARARAMYLRARGYCWRALEVQQPGMRAALAADPRRALARLQSGDVPIMYWLCASWGGELSLAANQLLRLADLVSIRLILARALVLDEGWESGALHEALVALDGMSPLLGGSAARAREHFDRAVALSGGQSAFAYVALASTVSVAARDRTEFERLLRAALAIDLDARPALRLANLVAQRRARALLAQANALFPPSR
jgi:predicted anti-sigma-YlaC factor YlaD